jgi:hypothetical protein
MTAILNRTAKISSLRFALPALLAVLAVSCATMVHPPQNFLSSTDESWNQWLDTAVDVDLAEVRVMHLPLTDAFSGLRIAIAQADAPVESLRLTFHASDVTRRQALWLLAQKYNLTMTVQQLPGQLPYIGISKQ